MIDAQVLDFIKNSRVLALTVLLPDSTPHTSAMHFAHRDDPLTFIFLTEKGSLKVSALKDKKRQLGAITIGFDEKEMVTLQLHGEVSRLEKSDELAKLKEIYFKKFPQNKKYENDPESVFLSFTPSWFRYSDYKVKPVKIISSEN